MLRKVLSFTKSIFSLFDSGLKRFSALPSDFDRDAYLVLHKDVRESGIDPVKHFLKHGKKENRAYKKTVSFEDRFSRYLTLLPSEQNAFDLFPSSWSTSFSGVETKGSFNGTQDSRIQWLMQQLDLVNLNVLELGPLEAGHTYMLEKLGGAKVVAVESNVGAFLRCLIVKNHLNLSAQFLLGDFEKIDFSSRQHDLIVASGVLYHLKDPVEFLLRISESTDRLFIWTHYFDPDFSKWNNGLMKPIDLGKWDYENPITKVIKGKTVRMVKQSYGEALGWSGFCGGTDVYSHWIFKEDLLSLLRDIGFKKLEISFDAIDHPNGPSFCVYCEK